MESTMNTCPRKQHGAALVVGLILLVVVTVLAISGVNTATTELALARNDQNYENAFQAAETGLEQALARDSYDPATTVTLNENVIANDSVTTQIAFEETTIVPPSTRRAFSLGAGIAAHHFVATATATSARDAGGTTDRDASAVHTQAFYIIGPAPPTL